MVAKYFLHLKWWHIRKSQRTSLSSFYHFNFIWIWPKQIQYSSPSSFTRSQLWNGFKWMWICVFHEWHQACLYIFDPKPLVTKSTIPSLSPSAWRNYSQWTAQMVKTKWHKGIFDSLSLVIFSCTSQNPLTPPNRQVCDVLMVMNSTNDKNQMIWSKFRYVWLLSCVGLDALNVQHITTTQ